MYLATPDEEALFARLMAGVADLPRAEVEPTLRLLAQPFDAGARGRFAQLAVERGLIAPERRDLFVATLPDAPEPEPEENEPTLAGAGPAAPDADAADAVTVVGRRPGGPGEYAGGGTDDAPGATPPPSGDAGGTVIVPPPSRPNRFLPAGVTIGGAETIATQPTAGSTVPVLPRSGGLLFGRYHLLRALGRGGMGTVWKVWDVELCRVVALKLIRPAAAADDEYLARFRREAQLLARLRHPHVVRVYDVGEQSGRHYLTMDFLEGRTLEDRWGVDYEARQRPAPPDPDRLRCDVALVADAAEAVGYAHREGIVHRDLKPGNLMLVDDPAAVDRGGLRVVVMDFGLAQVHGRTPEPGHRITLAGQAVGTPSYMAPEQATGDREQIGPPTDVWAFGTLLYELLCGRPPFLGESAVEIMNQVVGAEPKPPRARNPHLPAELDAVCLKALEKEPARRYANAGEFAAELRRWLRGEPVQARPFSPARRLLRGLRRHAFAAGGLALVLALAGLGLAAGWFERGRNEDEARAILEPIVSSVRAFEDSVQRTDLPAAARLAIAEQPLGLLERVIAADPGFGAAYAWRGRVKEMLDDPAGAGADYDRGCAAAGLDPVPWVLRGVSRIETYRTLRGLPGATGGGRTGFRFVPLPPETPEQARLRETGLADLARAEALPESGGPLTRTELRCARALALVHAGDAAGIVRAEELLRDEDHPKAHKLRAIALYLSTRFEAAVEAFGRTIATWPGELEARHYRGLSMQAAAFEAEARGEDPRERLRRLIAEIDTVVERAPAWAEPRGNRGAAWMSLGTAEEGYGVDPFPDYQRAVDDFTAAMKLAPGATWALNNRGMVLRRAGVNEASHGRPYAHCFEKSIQDFTESARIRAEDATTWGHRGQAWAAWARLEEADGRDGREMLVKAIADYGEAIRRDPSAVWVRQDRALHLLALGDAELRRGGDPLPRFEQAVAELEEAVRSDPERPGAHAALGEVLKRIGDAAERGSGDGRERLRGAIAAYDRAVALEPDDPTKRLARGGVYQALGNARMKRGEDPGPSWAAAHADLDAILARHPDQIDALHNRASLAHNLALWRQSKGEDARDVFRRAIVQYGEVLRRQPDYVPTLVGRGISWAELAEAEARTGADARASWRSAVADFAAARALDPRHAEAMRWCGQARLKFATAEFLRGADGRREYREAIADLDAAIAVAPDQGRLFNERAEAWLSLTNALQRAGAPVDEALARGVADLLEAARLGHHAAWWSLARAYAGMARYEEAIAACDEHARRAPEEAGRVRAAADDLRARARLAREAWAAALDDGSNRLRAGDYPGAKERYEAGFRLLDESLATMPAAERDALLAIPAARTRLMDAHYNLACVESLASTGRDRPGGPAREIAPDLRAACCDRAFHHLGEAVRFGFTDRRQWEVDPDLEALRGDPRFAEVLRR